MKNLLLFSLVCLLVGGAVLLGGRAPAGPRPPQSERPAPPIQEPPPADEPGVPHIGSVQVLNGCGIHNAAVDVADFLRGLGFDVKNVDNAPSWNYRDTYVVARTADRRNAQRAAHALNTERLVLMRTGEQLYDVVVYVGSDYRERIR